MLTDGAIAFVEYCESLDTLDIAAGPLELVTGGRALPTPAVVHTRITPDASEWTVGDAFPDWLGAARVAGRLRQDCPTVSVDRVPLPKPLTFIATGTAGAALVGTGVEIHDLRGAALTSRYVGGATLTAGLTVAGRPWFGDADGELYELLEGGRLLKRTQLPERIVAMAGTDAPFEISAIDRRGNTLAISGDPPRPRGWASEHWPGRDLESLHRTVVVTDPGESVDVDGHNVWRFTRDARFIREVMLTSDGAPDTSARPTALAPIGDELFVVATTDEPNPQTWIYAFDERAAAWAPRERLATDETVAAIGAVDLPARSCEGHPPSFVFLTTGRIGVHAFAARECPLSTIAPYDLESMVSAGRSTVVVGRRGEREVFVVRVEYATGRD